MPTTTLSDIYQTMSDSVRREIDRQIVEDIRRLAETQPIDPNVMTAEQHDYEYSMSEEDKYLERMGL